jgi:dethiobiotin synthase
MTASWCVLGPGHGCGKTFVILGLHRWLSEAGHRVGLYKPVDVGALQARAEERQTDVERYQNLGLTEHVSLLNPYLLEERRPPELAARRDGVRIRKTLLTERWKMLEAEHAGLLVEGPSGLRLPLQRQETFLDLLQEQRPQVLWVSSVGELELELSLLQLKLLLELGLQVRVLLNNRDDSRDGWMLQYQWLTLEEQLGVTVHGLLPFLKSGSEDPDAISGLLQEHLEEPLKEEFVSWLT